MASKKYKNFFAVLDSIPAHHSTPNTTLDTEGTDYDDGPPAKKFKFSVSQYESALAGEATPDLLHEMNAILGNDFAAFVGFELKANMNQEIISAPDAEIQEHHVEPSTQIEFLQPLPEGTPAD